MMMSLILAAASSADQGASLNINWIGLFRTILSCASMLTGIFFVMAGTLGVLRLPDFYTRLHAAGMTDTLGAELVILGLIIQSGFTQMSLKLLLVAFFLLLTSPTATHAIANAAYKAKLNPKLGKYTAPSVDGDGS